MTPARDSAHPSASRSSAGRSSLVDGAAAARASGRDLVVDLARVFCVVAVVLLHSLMIGLHRDGDTITQINPLETKEWFALGTWVGQIMPLFFVVGGFAGITSWRGAERKGAAPADYLRARVQRLLRPTLPLLFVLTVALWLGLAVGVDPALLDLVAAGVGMPLWFLAAFIVCQVFLPLTVRLHTVHPFALLAVLVGGALCVDGLRLLTGVTAIGLVNLVFVWLAVQQLGYLYADGWFRERARWTLVGIVVGSYGLLAVLTYGLGLYPVDMLTNLNPATVPLIVLGLAQAALLTLLHPLLDRLMRVKLVLAACFAIGARAMTIYLWHLPVIVALAGGAFLLGWQRSEPGSGEWFATRPLLIVCVAVVLAGIAAVVGRFERGSRRTDTRHERDSQVYVAAILAALCFVAEIQWGLSLWLTTVSAVVVLLALIMIRPRRVAPPIRLTPR